MTDQPIVVTCTEKTDCACPVHRVFRGAESGGVTLSEDEARVIVDLLQTHGETRNLLASKGVHVIRRADGALAFMMAADPDPEPGPVRTTH